MPLSRTFAACLIAAIPAIAQPPSLSSAAVTGTHIHLNSADPDAAIAFWNDIVGTSTSSDSKNGVSTIGMTILFARKTPSGPSAGSVIDHLAFRIPDLQPLIGRLAKTPYKSFHPPAAEDRLMVDGPDGVRIEFIADNSMYAPLEFSHIHLNSPQPKEMQAWFAKNIGGRAGMDDEANSLVIAGTNLTFDHADAVVPSSERAIDRLVFEVKDLDSFCRKLTESGLKPEVNASVAFLTDPWGTRIELTAKSAR